MAVFPASVKLAYKITGVDTWVITDYADYIIPPINISYGITSNYPPGAHMADIGQMTFRFDNSSSDFTFSPGTTGIKGFTVGERWGLVIEYDGIHYTKFMGRIKNINAVPGLFDERVTEVTLLDYISDLTRAKIGQMAVQTNVRSSNLVNTILNNLIVQPEMQSADSNGDTFTYALHDVRIEQTSGYNAIARVTQSELGHFFIEGRWTATASDAGTVGGRATYRPRDAWVNNGTYLGALTDNFTTLDAAIDHDMIIDPVNITYYPAYVSATDEVLFWSDEPASVGADNTRRITCYYFDPNNPDVRVSAISSDIVTPVSGTDYTISYTEGATDNGAASDVTVTLTVSGNSAQYNFTHDSGAAINKCWINYYQIRGKCITLYNWQQQSAGTNPLSPASTDFPGDLDMLSPYQDDPEQIQSMADWIYYKFGQARYEASYVSFVANASSDYMYMACLGEPGDYVDINETVTGIAQEHIITAVDLSIDENFLITCGWTVAPVDTYCDQYTDSDGNIYADSDGNKYCGVY